MNKLSNNIRQTMFSTQYEYFESTYQSVAQYLLNNQIPAYPILSHFNGSNIGQFNMI